MQARSKLNGMGVHIYAKPAAMNQQHRQASTQPHRTQNALQGFQISMTNTHTPPSHPDNDEKKGVVEDDPGASAQARRSSPAGIDDRTARPPQCG